MKVVLPKKWLNATLFYVGCVGLVLQVAAALTIWWHSYDHPGMPWYIWLAPVMLICWGLLPALQLQNEHPGKNGEVRIKV